MVLSKRERYIVIAVLIAGLALVLDRVATFVKGALGETAQTRQGLEEKRNSALAAMKLSRQMEPKWRDMLQTGIMTDPAESETQVLQSLHDWAAASGLSLPNLKAGRPPRVEKSPLAEITFEASGTGTIGSIARLGSIPQFLLRVQTAAIPLRITSLTLTSRKEGVDDVGMTLRLSTAYLPGGKRPTSQASPVAAPPAAIPPAPVPPAAPLPIPSAAPRATVPAPGAATSPATMPATVPASAPSSIPAGAPSSVPSSLPAIVPATGVGQ